MIEAMVATAVLSLGIVLIYQALFISLDSYRYYADYLSVSPWVNEKIWAAQDALTHLGGAARIAGNGEFISRNKNFQWNLSYNPAGEKDLYKIDLILNWQQGQRRARLLRSGYAIYVEKE